MDIAILILAGLIVAAAIWMFFSMGFVKQEASLEERLASAGKVAGDLYYDKSSKQKNLIERARKKMINSGVKSEISHISGPWQTRTYTGNVKIDVGNDLHAEVYLIDNKVGNDVTYEHMLKEDGLPWEDRLEKMRAMPEHFKKGISKPQASYRIPIAETDAGELFFENQINFGWFVGVGIDYSEKKWTKAKFDLKLPNSIYLKDLLPQILQFAKELEGVKVKPLYFTKDGKPAISEGSHIYVYVRKGEEGKIPEILRRANTVGTRIWGNEFKPNYNDWSSAQKFNAVGIDKK
jgi:hypothetical protein